MRIVLALIIGEAALVYFAEVCRHGARAPVNFMPWDNFDRWPNGAKNLVNEGFRQQYLVGRYLRHRYIMNDKLLSDSYNSSEIEVYSTSISRSIFSMESQLLGLYPQDELYMDQVLLPSGPKDTVLATKTPLIPVYLNEAKIDPMLMIEDYCKPYEANVKSRKSSPHFFKLFNNYPDLISSVSSYFNMTKEQSSINFLNVLSSVTSNHFMGYEVPTVFDQDWQDRAQGLYLDLRRYMRYSTEYSRKLAASEFFNKLDEQFTNKIKGKTNLKATLYSAHDTTIMNIFAFLNHSIAIQPPFASVLLFELHQIQDDYFVKVDYNDVSLSLQFCGKIFCEFLKFKEFVRSFSFKNITEACANFPAFEHEPEVSVQEKVSEIKEDGIEIVVEQVEEEEESNILVVVTFFTILVLVALYYLIKKIPR